MAQPALSQQLAKLEDEVGRPLLQRSTRGVTPTENGLALYHHARSCCVSFDQALSIARQENGEVRGMVSLGLPATTVRAIGLPLMKRIHEKYPGILLNVVEGMSGHIAQMMRLGQLDLAILFSNDVSSKLDATPLLEEELFVLLPKKAGWCRRGQTSITIAEAAKLPLILPTSSHGLRRRVVAEFERRELTPHVVAEIDSLTLLMSCVFDGMGVHHQADVRAADRGRGKQALARAVDRRRQHYPAQLPLLDRGEPALPRSVGGGDRIAGHCAPSRDVEAMAGRVIDRDVLPSPEMQKAEGLEIVG